MLPEKIEDFEVLCLEEVLTEQAWQYISTRRKEEGISFSDFKNFLEGFQPSENREDVRFAQQESPNNLLAAEYKRKQASRDQTTDAMLAGGDILDQAMERGQPLEQPVSPRSVADQSEKDKEVDEVTEGIIKERRAKQQELQNAEEERRRVIEERNKDIDNREKRKELVKQLGERARSVVNAQDPHLIEAVLGDNKYDETLRSNGKKTTSIYKAIKAEDRVAAYVDVDRREDTAIKQPTSIERKLDILPLSPLKQKIVGVHQARGKEEEIVIDDLSSEESVDLERGNNQWEDRHDIWLSPRTGDLNDDRGIQPFQPNALTSSVFANAQLPSPIKRRRKKGG